ncbi:MAG: PqqD family protein [Thaumarchaeota archaeon]|nr:PqqD family protein [Nitrososphaerota archaeon]
MKVRAEKRGTVIFDTLNEKVYMINETGASILKLLLSGNTLDVTAKVLAQDYNGDEVAVVRNDVIQFVDELAARSLVVKVPAT